MRLIDADVLKEVIHSKSEGMEDLWDTAGVLNAINNSPTVDLWQLRQEATENALKKAEALYGRTQGEWIEHNGYYDSHSYKMFFSCECSICHMYEDFPQDDETGNILASHYCKYCGSNMWKEE